MSNYLTSIAATTHSAERRAYRAAARAAGADVVVGPCDNLVAEVPGWWQPEAVCAADAAIRRAMAPWWGGDRVDAVEQAATEGFAAAERRGWSHAACDRAATRARDREAARWDAAREAVQR